MWLGPGTEASDGAMEFLHRVGPRALACGALDLQWPGEGPHTDIHDYLARRSPAQQVDNDSAGASELARFVFDLLHEDGLQSKRSSHGLCSGIEDVLQRDYWHRIWIIQEVTLAKEAFIMCGQRSISLDAFNATFNAIWYCTTSGIRDTQPEYEHFGGSLYGTLFPVNALTTRRRYLLGHQIQLIDILFQSRAAPFRPHYSASDPCDIVFGLLGVISDGESLGLRADYTTTPVQIFTMITKAWVLYGDEHHGRFKLGWCTPRKEIGPLPSWVPDWQMVGKYGFRVYPIDYSASFDAASGIQALEPAASSNCLDPLVLRRSGCQVDVIMDVLPPPEWIKSNEWAVSWIKDADTWFASICSFAGLGPESGPAEDFVWRTILRGGSSFYRDRRESEAISEDIAKLIRLILRGEHIDTNALTDDQVKFFRDGTVLYLPSSLEFKSFDDQVAYITQQWKENIGAVNRHRTLFKTAKGMFGLGHEAIKPGDVVSLLWGSKCPIILQPRDTGGFLFRGDCYVDGIMHGEYLKTDPVYEHFDIH